MVGSLFVHIPDLGDLNKKPVIFRLENIFLLASPRGYDNISPEEVSEQFQKTKMKLLQMAEFFSSPAKERTLKDSGESLGWLDSLKLNITANLQLFIDKIHIRYEDTSQVTNKVPFVFGLTIESLQMQSVDEQWKPSFVGRENITRKLVSLSNIGLYYNTRQVNNSPLIWKNSEELSAAMDTMIYKSESKLLLNDYLIFPISGEFRVTINKTKSFIEPVLNVSGSINSVNLKLSAEQFHGIVNFIAWSRGYNSRLKYISLHQYKPISSKTENINTKAMKWWYYAFKCISRDIEEKNKIWNPQLLEKRHNDRIRYRKVYEKVVKGRSLSSEEQKIINDIEYVYSVPELILFRRCEINNNSTKNEITKDLTNSKEIPKEETNKSPEKSLSSSDKNLPSAEKTFFDTFSSFFNKSSEV